MLKFGTDCLSGPWCITGGAALFEKYGTPMLGFKVGFAIIWSSKSNLLLLRLFSCDVSLDQQGGQMFNIYLHSNIPIKYGILAVPLLNALLYSSGKNG